MLEYPHLSIISTARGDYYGFQIYGIPRVKVGKHQHLAETVDPASVAEPTRKDEHVLWSFTERYFPEGAGPTMSLKKCLFTNSPDVEFIIDRHPEHPQVVIGAGFTGHGFEMSAAIGELLADLARRVETDHPPEPFRLDRFWD